jgi:hypothetical protein
VAKLISLRSYLLTARRHRRIHWTALMQAPPNSASVRVPGSGIVAAVAIIQVDPPSEVIGGFGGIEVRFHAKFVPIPLS